MKEDLLLQTLLRWFDDYVADYYTGDEEHDYNISLKQIHTHRVLDRITDLGKRIGTCGPVRFRAEAAALLHDCGRFEQYRRYRSFRDDVTVDHGNLGVRVIRDSNLLEGYGREARRDILFSVEYHNKKELPRSPSRTALEITRMVRDADRMDIFRVIAGELDNGADRRGNTVFWDLDQEEDISDPVYEALSRRLPVDRGDMRTRTDFLCMVLSWVYLMNFSESLLLIAETGLLGRLTGNLPDTERGRAVRAGIEAFIECP